MASADQNTMLLQQILHELQTLNDNLAQGTAQGMAPSLAAAIVGGPDAVMAMNRRKGARRARETRGKRK